MSLVLAALPDRRTRRIETRYGKPKVRWMVSQDEAVAVGRAPFEWSTGESVLSPNLTIVAVQNCEQTSRIGCVQ